MVRLCLAGEVIIPSSAEKDYNTRSRQSPNTGASLGADKKIAATGIAAERWITHAWFLPLMSRLTSPTVLHINPLRYKGIFRGLAR